MPDWLRGAAGESVESEQTATPPDTLGPATEIPTETSPAATESPLPPAAGELPDWLAATAEGLPSAPTAETQPETPATEQHTEVEAPDWLAELSETSPAQAPAAQEAPSVGTPAADLVPTVPAEEVVVPDWLAGLGEVPGSEPTTAEEGPPPAEEITAPDWLVELGETPPVRPSTMQEAPDLPEGVGIPGWLRGLGEPPAVAGAPAPGVEAAWELSSPKEEIPATEPVALEPLTGQTLEPAPAGIAEIAPDEETPDWLSMMELGESLAAPVAEAPVPSSGEDLLGLSEDLLRPAEPKEESVELEMAELPDWLREAAPGEETARLAGRAASPEMAGSLAAQIEDLRFDAITGYAGRVEGVTETVGALKDVAGVIRPEILFDGASLEVGKLVDQVILSQDQARRVEKLQAMWARQAQGVTVAGKKRSIIPLIRWLTALALVAAVAAGSLLSLFSLPAPAPGPGPAQAYRTLQGLPTGATVIAAFEYEPDTAAELQPLARALLSHLSRRGDVTLYALSTRTTGPAMAQLVLESVEGAPDGWVNLGYLPGGINGISALVVGSLPGVPSPLAHDYQGQPSGLTATRLTDLRPSLIVVFAARSESLRAWVEQAGMPAQVPILAAMSVGSAPLAYPYQQSGQLVAVLSGVNDAAAYQALESAPDDPSLNATWNGQAWGGVVAALLIAGGSLIYGLVGLRQHQEQAV